MRERTVLQLWGAESGNQFFRIIGTALIGCQVISKRAADTSPVLLEFRTKQYQGRSGQTDPGIHSEASMNINWPRCIWLSCVLAGFQQFAFPADSFFLSLSAAEGVRALSKKRNGVPSGDLVRAAGAVYR